MRSAAIILSLCLLSAAPPSESAPAPAAAAAIHEATVDVSIQGPTTASGGFALVGSGPKDAVLRWRIESPDGAAEPLRLLDASGAPVLVFMSPSAGRYRVVLTGQVASDGLDPFGEATHVVTVGAVPPPVPVPPKPVPGPDLTGIAKAAYDAAPKGRPAEAQTVAGIYRGVASAGAAVSTMTPAEMASKLTTDMRASLTADQRTAWASFGSTMAAHLKAASGRDKTIETLNSIADGVEVVR